MSPSEMTIILLGGLWSLFSSCSIGFTLFLKAEVKLPSKRTATGKFPLSYPSVVFSGKSRTISLGVPSSLDRGEEESSTDFLMPLLRVSILLTNWRRIPSKFLLIMWLLAERIIGEYTQGMGVYWVWLPLPCATTIWVKYQSLIRS